MEDLLNQSKVKIYMDKLTGKSPIKLAVMMLSSDKIWNQWKDIQVLFTEHSLTKEKYYKEQQQKS
jgi:hypothetical protein